MRNALFAGTVLGALGLAAAASAQGSPSPGDASAQSPVERPMSTAPEAALQEVVVFGRGQTRQVETINNVDIVKAAPGSSPYKVLSKLPSVNFQSADPFGAYEWAERISIRGFAQNQLGYTLDDVPLGDQSYANDTGLHISRAITSENIARTDLSQGTGSLDTASVTNIGGTLRFYSLDPSRTPAVEADLTYGSEDTKRALLRVETGELPGGGRGYISYSYLGADKWKGDGDQVAHQVNSKYVQPLGEHGALTGFLDYSRRNEHDYQDLSLTLIRKDGYGLDNISNNYPLAQALAKIGSNSGYTGVGITYPGFGKAFPAPYINADDVYFDAGGNRLDYIGGLRLDYDLTEDLKVRATAYGHYNKGVGTYDTPYTPTPSPTDANGIPLSALSLRTTEYRIQREGVVSSATYTLGRHSIEASFWFENNVFHQARRFYPLGPDAPGRDAGDFQNADGAFFTQWLYAFNTKTYDGSLQDTWRVTDAFKVNFGFKAVHVDNTARTLLATSDSLLINGKIDTDEPFLPQVGANYQFDRHNEVFIDYAKNINAFASSHTGNSPFATTQAGFNAIRDGLQPEKTNTVEGGYRFTFPQVEGVLAGYYVKFHNRLLATQVGEGIVGNPTAISNVGGVTSNGFEAAATWRFYPHWSLFGSYSYNNSTYDGDEFDGGGNLIARTAGKTTVDTPKQTAKGELSYDDGSLFFNANAYYLTKRYYTYTNDGTVPSYVTLDLSVGYRFHSLNPVLNGVELQLNVTNATDLRYISTIGTNGFVPSDPTGLFPTLQAGSPREVFGTVRKRF